MNQWKIVQWMRGVLPCRVCSGGERAWIVVDCNQRDKQSRSCGMQQSRLWTVCGLVDSLWTCGQCVDSVWIVWRYCHVEIMLCGDRVVWRYCGETVRRYCKLWRSAVECKCHRGTMVQRRPACLCSCGCLMRERYNTHARDIIKAMAKLALGPQL